MYLNACQAAGLHNHLAHGCRHTRCCRSWCNGCTAQRDLWLDKHGMASLYTEAADRKRLMLEAMAKVQGANETATSIHSPSRKVRAVARKKRLMSGVYFSSGAVESRRSGHYVARPSAGFS